MQLWVERDPTMPFTAKFLAELAAKLQGGVGCIGFDRVIIRVIDPANTHSGVNEFGLLQERDSFPTFLYAFLASLKNWDGEVLVLPYVVKGTPWSVGSSDKESIQQATQWVLQMNTLAQKYHTHTINGVVFEAENSGYASQDPTTLQLVKAVVPSDSMLKFVCAPPGIVSGLDTVGWDEAIVQLYNLTNATHVAGEYVSGKWRWPVQPASGGTSTGCNSTVLDADNNGRGICGFQQHTGEPVPRPITVAESQDPKTCGMLASNCVQDNPKWVATDSAQRAKTTDPSTYLPSRTKSVYTELHGEPASLANWFNWYLLANHSGSPLKTVGWMKARDVPLWGDSKTVVSYLLSTECTTEGCTCPAPSTSRVGCGTIDAFGTWSRGDVEKFAQGIFTQGGQRGGLFQYNLIPVGWWS